MVAAEVQVSTGSDFHAQCRLLVVGQEGISAALLQAQGSGRRHFHGGHEVLQTKVEARFANTPIQVGAL